MLGKLVLLLLVASACASQYRPKYPKKPTGCSYKGRDYNVGQKFPAGDDCNTCTCKRNGRVDCSDKTCFCKYNGKKVKVGESVPKGDNCNTCTCKSNGRVSCTDKKCDVCSEPKPNCQGYFKRWYYNSHSNKCEQFTGCKGKGNNFNSKNACDRECNKSYGK
uniref:Kielin/chordin-like protein n=1 Tax=Crassostrea virginica TaxID=6565 RepID=A0A8B8C9D2_CRAVI|nr:kielin/chordin-like protein [Crassostrea virginica]XP_022312436.1 kielin/chordin-like protein [Crassostrea virginica]